MSRKTSNDVFRCTACARSIRTSLEANLHPLLDCLICRTCYKTYGTGDFASAWPDGIDENGDDNYCRWCCDGGDLFGCMNSTDPEGLDRCHYSFCKDCIERNVSDDEILKDKDEPDFKWSCYSCDKSKIEKLIVEAQNAMKILNEKAYGNNKTPQSLQKKRDGKPDLIDEVPRKKAKADISSEVQPIKANDAPSLKPTTKTVEAPVKTPNKVAETPTKPFTKPIETPTKPPYRASDPASKLQGDSELIKLTGKSSVHGKISLPRPGSRIPSRASTESNSSKTGTEKPVPSTIPLTHQPFKSPVIEEIPKQPPQVPEKPLTGLEPSIKMPPKTSSGIEPQAKAPAKSLTGIETTAKTSFKPITEPSVKTNHKAAPGPSNGPPKSTTPSNTDKTPKGSSNVPNKSTDNSVPDKIQGIWPKSSPAPVVSDKLENIKPEELARRLEMWKGMQIECTSQVNTMFGTICQLAKEANKDPVNKLGLSLQVEAIVRPISSLTKIVDDIRNLLE